MRTLILTLGTYATALALQDQDHLHGAPIHYDEPATAGPVEALARGLETGEVELEFDPDHGYLPALLGALGVPPTSQTLVFSKTSFQNEWISPKHPRALYFGPSVYVGAVPGAPVLEVSSMDPERGPVFYTLGQQVEDGPRLVRQHGECLQCHASSRTRNWPGNLLRSVHPDSTGLPILRSGTEAVTHATPFEDRWGGWYVTGTHGEARHRGNAIADFETERVDPEAGANLTDLTLRIESERYLSPHSDIVALLVLEHQAEMHNLIARAHYEVRLALDRQAESNAFFGDPPGTLRDSTRRLLESQSRKLLEYMLFEDEIRLPGPIQGTTPFAEEFMAAGARDGKGRSLRDLRLDQRLFHYPCSYLIDSPAFDGLPPELLDVVYRELWGILNGSPGSDQHPRLTLRARAAIREILIATKDDLPPYWNH